MALGSLTAGAQRCFVEERIPVQKGKLWGFCDSNGKMIIQPAFTTAYPYNYRGDLSYVSGTYAIVKKNGLLYLLDFDGNLRDVVESKIEEEIDSKPEPSTFKPSTITEKNSTLKKYKENGKEGALKFNRNFLPAEYDEVQIPDKEADIFLVRNGRRWGLMAEKPELKIPILYDSLVYLKMYGIYEFYVAARLKGKWKLLNYRNEDIGKDLYDEIRFNNEQNVYFAVRKGKKWGIIGNEGRKVSEFKYDAIDLRFILQNLFLVTQNGKKFYVDCRGKEYK
jgi:hypothetical protein